MPHLVKLGKQFFGEACHRVFEQKIETQEDIRSFTAYLQAELLKANREARTLVVETWSDYQEPARTPTSGETSWEN